MEKGVIVGISSANHSVMKVLGRLYTGIPRVALRDSTEQGSGPIMRPKSVEVPKGESDSRYQLQGEIARGGMGAIIKGRDTDLGRDLAIKVLLDHHVDAPDIIHRFVEEAQISGQLQHPGIVPVYELGQFCDQRPFFSMKLVKGKTLSALLAERSDLTEDRAKFLGIFEQVCQTMAYAHSRGVIHRDLKPANIMVGAFGEVQVMDWGLAKVLAQGGVEDEHRDQQKNTELSVIQTLRSLGSNPPTGSASGSSSTSDTEMGSVMGTAAYMPPEQALGEVDRLDERADVFGLGGLLSQILTGKPPYVKNKRADVFRMASRGKIGECMQRLASCGADETLLSIARNCLELEPTDRFRNAGVVAEHVSEYLESVDQRLRDAEMGKARKAARAEQATIVASAAEARANAESRLSRLKLGLAAVVLLFSTAAFVTTSWFLQEQTRQTAEIEQAFESKSDYLYVAHLQTIDQAWKNGEVRRVRKLLDQHLPQPGKTDRRTFEWFHYDRICRQRDAFPALPYGHIISGLAVAPTGDFVALSGVDTNIQIFDLLNNERISTLTSHQSEVKSLQFSNDGRILVSSDDSRTFCVWHRPVEQFELLMEGTSPRSYQLKLSEDSQHLAIPGTTSVALYDLLQPDRPKNLELTVALTDLQWVPMTSQLAVALEDGSVSLWDGIEAEQIRTIIKSPEPAAEILFSEDGRHLVTASDSALQFYRTTESGMATLTHDAGKPDSKFKDLLPMKTTFAVRTNRSLSLWDFEAQQMKGKIDNTAESLNQVVSSLDGKLIATAGSNPVISLWNGQTGRKLRNINRNSNEVYALGFDPQGRLISGGRDKVAIVARPEKLGQAMSLRGHQGWIWSVDYSTSGNVLASGSQDTKIILWDANTGAQIKQLTDHTGSVQFVTFSPTESVLASASRDDSIRFWDTETYTIIEECRKHTADVNSLDYSADGTLLVSGADDGNVIVWDVATKSVLAKHHVDQGKVWAVAFAADGSVAFGGTNQTVSTWDFASGHPPKSLYKCDFNITSLRFSNDRDTLACSTSDGTILTFDYQQRTIRGQPAAPHSTDAMTAVFSPDGQSLISCGSDGKICFRYLKIDEPTIQIDAHDDHIHSVAFSPDGNRIASGSWDHSVRIWSVL